MKHKTYKDELRDSLMNSYRRHVDKLSAFLNSADQLEEMEMIIPDEHKDYINSIPEIIHYRQKITSLKAKLLTAKESPSKAPLAPEYNSIPDHPTPRWNQTQMF